MWSDDGTRTMAGMWKTEICKFNFLKGCKHAVCAFAHSFTELRNSHSYVEKKEY